MPRPSRSDSPCAESQPQVEQLGEALHQLAAALAEPHGAARPEAAELVAIMRGAVMRLQFYDRMTQHLSHVQDYLSRSGHQIGSPEPAGGWTGVHQQLSERLLSDTQRFHLGRNFQDELRAAAGGEDTRARRPRPAGRHRPVLNAARALARHPCAVCLDSPP